MKAIKKNYLTKKNKAMQIKTIEKVIINGSADLLCCGKVSQNFRFKNKINKYKPNIG